MCDDLGRLILAGTNWDVGMYYILGAEALYLKETIQGAIKMQLGNVVVKSDSQRVVQAITSHPIGRSQVNLIIIAIQNFLLLFPNSEVKFVKRQSNMVVHSLAKAAISWTRRDDQNVHPSCISKLLINKLR